MDVIELTRQLGAAIQQEEVYAEYKKAREANDADEALQGLIGEFNLLRMSLTNELQKQSADQNEDKINELNEQLQKIYGEVMANETMMKFNEAKQKMDNLTNQITSIIAMCIEGQDPATCQPPTSSCSGSCSTCGGCH